MAMDGRRLTGVTALALALVLGACGANEADGAAEGEGVTGRVLNVEVREVTPTEFVEIIRVTGTVEANRDVVVSAEESGVVTEVLVPKGAPVRAGQPLLRIDDRLLRSQVAQARAQAELAREVWERRKRLFEEDHVGSELAYLEARSQAEQAAAALATLEQRMDRTLVRAPVEGILDARMVEVGTMVNPGAPVVRIVDLDPVKIAGGIPERYAADVRAGTRATVTFDALDTQSLSGTVQFVGSAVNPANRTFPIEIQLPNPGRAIKPEMVAHVEVVRRTLEDAVVVPQEALVRVEDGYVVFVLAGGEPQTVVAKPVTLGPSQRNQVVITSGLEPGERLVVVGQKQVTTGDRVRVVAER